jgi:hypothetical protein
MTGVSGSSPQQAAQAVQQRERIQVEREVRQEAEEIAREARRAAEEAVRAVQGGKGPVIIRQDPGGHPVILHDPNRPERTVPPEVVDIVGMLTFGAAAVLILRPLMRAFANRFERRGTPTAVLPPEVGAHMQRLEQAIEAVAIEVERISEGQRYTTKLLSEKAAEPR